MSQAPVRRAVSRTASLALVFVGLSLVLYSAGAPLWGDLYSALHPPARYHYYFFVDNRPPLEITTTCILGLLCIAGGVLVWRVGGKSTRE